MKKEYLIFNHDGSSGASRALELLLSEEWSIERTDACSTFVLYVLTRVKVIESTVNRVPSEASAKKRRR